MWNNYKVSIESHNGHDVLITVYSSNQVTRKIPQTTRNIHLKKNPSEKKIQKPSCEGKGS